MGQVRSDDLSNLGRAARIPVIGMVVIIRARGQRALHLAAVDAVAAQYTRGSISRTRDQAAPGERSARGVSQLTVPDAHTE